MLYLETAELPVKSVISGRRIKYLQTVLKRHKEELIYRVYSAMKEKPCKGDWIEKAMEDLKDIDMSLSNESEIEQMTKSEF